MPLRMDHNKFVSVKIPIGKSTATKIKVFHNDEEVLEVDLGEIYVDTKTNSKVYNDAKNLLRTDCKANYYKADGETFGKSGKTEERLIAQSTLVPNTDDGKLSLCSMTHCLTPTYGKSISPASSIGTLCESSQPMIHANEELDGTGSRDSNQLTKSRLSKGSMNRFMKLMINR